MSRKVRAKQVWTDMETMEEFKVLRVRMYDPRANNLRDYNGTVILYPRGGDRRQMHAQIEKNFDDFFFLVSEGY